MCSFWACLFLQLAFVFLSACINFTLVFMRFSCCSICFVSRVRFDIEETCIGPRCFSLLQEVANPSGLSCVFCCFSSLPTPNVPECVFVIYYCISRYGDLYLEIIEILWTED